MQVDVVADVQISLEHLRLSFPAGEYGVFPEPNVRVENAKDWEWAALPFEEASRKFSGTFQVTTWKDVSFQLWINICQGLAQLVRHGLY